MVSSTRSAHRTMRRRALPILTIIPILALLLIALPMLGIAPFAVPTAQAAGTLTVEIVAAYNLVVDSNATSPSTYAPSVATVFGRFCNTGDANLTNVYGYIGNYTNTTTFAPGVYPSRNSLTFGASHPLYNTGSYYFTHVGGSIGLQDATRYVGTIPAGQCRVQYWHFTYPQCSESDRTPPCSGLPVWGDSVKPDDDLWLQFDIWGTSDQGSANTTWTMTMRNEISAMANKIKPNPDGEWFNTKGDVIEVGGLITSNGILYELGVINQGFDNDGDWVPDYNAWMQPIGDASYDPSCFRIVRVRSTITVTRSGGNPDLIVRTDDLNPDPNYGGPLYYTNLPDDNTGTRGLVYYTFQAMKGPCSTALSPYQEVASGYDNEKFNGDYGVGIPPVGSEESKVTIDKSSSPNTVALGGSTTYSVPFANAGTGAAGMGLSTGGSTPLVISDTIPNGMRYYSSTTYLAFSPNTGVTTRYSTDSGTTWHAGLPPTTITSVAPNRLIVIQWWLNESLPAGSSGNYVRLRATVPMTYTGSALIDNCADARFGIAAPFDQACAPIIVQGTNSIGDRVWRDENSNGIQDTGENGIPNITVRLYYDRDGDQVLDDTDPLVTITTTNSSATGWNYVFPKLPNGNFIVQVDIYDSDIPRGYSPTTPSVHAVPGLGTTNPSPYLNADFGFGPALLLDKQQTNANPIYENGLVTYTISLFNTRPGDGTGSGACQYSVWAGHSHPYKGGDVPETSNGQWTLIDQAVGQPNGSFALNPLASANDVMGLGAFHISPQGGSISSAGVKARLHVREIADLQTGDQVLFRLYLNNTLVPGSEVIFDSTYFNKPVGSNYVIDVTLPSRTWQWSDFSNDYTEVAIIGNKGPGGTHGTIGVDAVEFVVPTDQTTCGGDDNTIVTLPLTDTYDADILQFVSASPTQNSATTSGSSPNTVGTVKWSNLGPLFAGQTKIVTVVLRARDNTTDGTVYTRNTAEVKNAYFGNGRRTNDPTDYITTTIDPTGSIGDFVWYDTDGDGVQDAGEAGIPGVRVRLCSNSSCSTGGGGIVYGETRTDASGKYLFSGLRDGTSYYVVVDQTTLPGGSGMWTCTYDATPLYDGVSGPVTINNHDSDSSNNYNLNQDFGFDSSASAIYGNVWEDANNNARYNTGTREPGEDGISGVTVWLCTFGTDCTSPVATTTTDARGNYFFGNVANGSYYVKVNTASLPSGGTWTNTVDPEGAPGNSQTNTIAVTAPGMYGSYNFGYYRGGSYALGDRVYVDWNGNGVQNSGEEGIKNITVWLYQDADLDGVIDPEDARIMTATTTITGYYRFPNLAGATSPGLGYIVVVDRTDPDFPAGYVQTQDPDESGVCTTCNSKGKRAVISSSDYTVDFGYKPTGSGSIGDFVWKDIDGDGIQDGGSEAGIANITVWLYADTNGDGTYTRVLTTTTNASGQYLFDSLPAGNYRVYVNTSDPDLPDDAFGQNYTLSTDNNPVSVALAAGQDYRDADFGFTAGGAIGDYVWQDNDGDGIQDEDEPGISGVTVWLYGWTDVDGDGVYDSGDTISSKPIMTRTTDAGGVYSFTSLPAGDYVVKVKTGAGTPLAGFTQTGDPDWTHVCSGAECDSASGVELAPGQVDMFRDFGYKPPYSLGDFVWLDLDGDGSQDPGEPGIGGVTVILTLPGGGTRTTVTDSDGHYSFGNLTNGSTYTVTVQTSALPPNLVATYDLDGGGDNRARVTINGADRWDVDFGYEYNGAYNLSGHVFYDDDDDGGYYTPAAGDTPYQGITVYLWNADGLLIGQTTTGANGAYTFTNLPNGNYYVSLDPNTPVLANLAMTSSPNELPGKCTTCHNYGEPTATTINGADVTQVDFGFVTRLDFGDLPDSYGTLLSSDGARHTVGNLYLGSRIDRDGDGRPATDATNDDNNGVDDEDGIVLDPGVTWAPSSNVVLTATVSGSGGYLVAFFDWNGDGDFDPAETVTLGAVVSGSNRLTVAVPATATPGTNMNARFRLYSGMPSSASPLGLANNGEVEDYRWPIGPTAVRLTYLGATAQPGYILVAWETASEMDNAGFDLYRREVGTETYARVNGSLIPSQAPGRGQGTGYTFTDPNVVAGVTYEYVLEDVDVNGVRTVHGPVVARALYTFFFPFIGK